MTLTTLFTTLRVPGLWRRLRRRGTWLRPNLKPRTRSAEPAYPTPWGVVRSTNGLLIALRNDSSEWVYHVRLLAMGLPAPGLSLPCDMAPGETLRVWCSPVAGQAAATRSPPDDARVIVQWRTADGVELLYPVTYS